MTTSDAFFILQKQAQEQGLFWFQGAGGNISFKENNSLWIKPTGYRISQLNSVKDLSQVDLDRFLKKFPELKTLNPSVREEGYKNLISDCSLIPARRPSMETGFHAVLPKTFVFHIHSLKGILLSDQIWNQREEFIQWYQKNWQGRLGNLDFISALLPGLELAVEIQNKKADLLFLQNHGSIFQFNETQQLQDFILFEQSFSEKFLPLSADDLSNPNLFKKGPIKNYFPDFAILWPRISKCLSPEQNQFYSFPDASKDPEAYEVWISTQYLYKNNPQLSEFPRHLSDQVAQLPTEVERKKQMGKNTQ